MKTDSSADEGEYSVVPELTESHPLFPFWSRSQLYDAVCSMYLDCWSDSEIAASLSTEYNEHISEHDVTIIRTEAAVAAESQPVEVRRRWLYRYSKLTVNNLVKEYMFLEKQHDVAIAKRALADEIDVLARNIPPNRLCVAVNDVIGRSNIGIKLINDLKDYAEEARKIDVIVRPYANAQKLTLNHATDQVAHDLYLQYPQCRNNPAKACNILANILGCPPHMTTTEDVAFLIEYDRLRGSNESSSTISLISHGADILNRPSSALEQAVAGAAYHFPYPSLVQIVESMRANPLMGRNDIRQVKEYAIRHRKDLDTLKQLGYQSSITKDAATQELTMLDRIVLLAEQHLSLLDHSTFLTGREIARAAKDKITANDLNTILTRLNAQSTADEIETLARQMLSGHRFEFPVKRYLAARFTLQS
ncbi:MAG: hypothetical protein WCN95_05255 [bacterium]